jgi:hypothetical protein
MTTQFYPTRPTVGVWPFDIKQLGRTGLPLYFSGALFSGIGGFVDAFFSALRYRFAAVLGRAASGFAGLLDVLTGFLRIVLRAVLFLRCLIWLR